MNPQTFILWASDNRERHIDNILRFLKALPTGVSWEISVKKHQKKRSNSQNSYLWGAVYPTILKSGGEIMGGWTADDLHDYYLGVHFGTEVLHLGGRDYERPLRRSSKLSTTEFMDYVATVQREAAGLGVFIPDPDPGWFLHQERAA